MYNGFVDDRFELSLIANDYVAFPFKLLLLFDTTIESECVSEKNYRDKDECHIEGKRGKRTSFF
jgi:hypothetical protein